MQSEKSVRKRFTLKATSALYQKEDNERVQMSKDRWRDSSNQKTLQTSQEKKVSILKNTTSSNF